MKLEGMTAIITGGAGSIGGATILALARQGADVVSLDLEEPEGQKALIGEVENLGRRAIALQGDITKKESVDSMITQVVRDFGKIDILVNVAGINIGAPLVDLSVELWDKVMAINLKSVFLCSVACAKVMMEQKRGNIINFAAASAHRVAGGSGAFGPSKAGVISLTKQMALEWAKDNLRVNCVSPGPVRTPKTEDRIKQNLDRIANIPFGRVAEMEEITGVVVFLASAESSYMTGQALVVDGGGVETWWLYP
jgi:NAD(P)-dependent dehydrogenase (short-subunit alcohol dehydrogenase family)